MQPKTTRQIQMPEDFILPFGGTLNKENRWVKMAALIPWWELEDRYSKNFKPTKKGEKAFSVRIALGALIIQTRQKLSDRETVNQIMESPYLQYFLGYERFEDRKPPFDTSMMVYFRKRLTGEVLIEINELIAKSSVKARPSKKKDNDDGPGSNSGITGSDQDNVKGSAPPNHGQLILDATCAPGDIRYPTDLRLLNEAREKLEDMVDTLHEPDTGKKTKPRTYREKARKDYLSIEKQRKKRKKSVLKAVRKQLGYVRRNLKIVARYFENGREPLLNSRQRKNLETIKLLYEQQRTMYQNKNHKIEERIVSISQPHIRPIVRGKAGADVEFGCKVLTAVVDGYSFIEKMSFDNFNEGIHLKEAVERYQKRFGYYPESVMVDTIFRNRDNRAWLKELGIRISGPRLGRPAKTIEKEQKRQEKLDAGIRNAIEGTYGTTKRKLGLGLIKAKLQETAESSIVLQFLVLNLERKLRVSLTNFIRKLFWLLKSGNIGCEASLC